MNEWNSKYNSELTTIKNVEFIKGWVCGFVAAFFLVLILISL